MIENCAIATMDGPRHDDGGAEYRRGHIAVLKRSALEARACECYAVVKQELSRLLSDVRARQDIPTYFQ